MTQPTSRKVRCKYFESGCGWRGPLSDRATHQAVCPVMENVTLRNQLANAQRRITSLENDKKKCENEKLAVKARCFENHMVFIFFSTQKHVEGFFLGGQLNLQNFLFKSAIGSAELYPLAALQAKLQSKEKFLLELQKEKHQMVLQTRELNREKNAMANRIKDAQFFFFRS